MKQRINVLDKGYVILHDVSGSDLDPVNAARVSYNKESEEFQPKDKGLLNFLGREDHTSPFRHSFMKFEVYAPLMVARQWMKYLVGSDHAEQPTRDNDPFFGWNESSRRYITEEVEFYVPQENEWRSAPANSKQGSGAPITDEKGAFHKNRLERFQSLGLSFYEDAIKDDIATEQARLFLPAYGMYVRWRWAGSLQGICHFLYQRLQHDSQLEIQEFARAVDQLARQYFPNAVGAYVDQKLNNNKVLEFVRQSGLSLEELQGCINIAKNLGDLGADKDGKEN